MEILFEASYTRIEYDAEKGIIILRLLGEIQHEDYKHMWDTLLQEVTSRNLNKLLADQTGLEKSSMESKAWLVSKWFPKAKKSLGNDMKVALVSSKSLFTRIGGEYIVNAVKSMSKFDIRLFRNAEAAMEWLSE